MQGVRGTCVAKGEGVKFATQILSPSVKAKGVILSITFGNPLVVACTPYPFGVRGKHRRCKESPSYPEGVIAYGESERTVGLPLAKVPLYPFAFGDAPKVQGVILSSISCHLR